jgi:AraC family transcriptional regulator
MDPWLVPLRRLEVGELTLTERRSPAGCLIERHGHAQTTITFMVGGACVEQIGAQSLECGSRSVRVLPAGEEHAQRCPVDTRCLTIEIAARKMEEIRRFSHVFDRRLVLESRLASLLAARVYREFRRADGASLLSMEGLTLELLAEVTRDGTRALSPDLPPWLRRARETIETRFTDELSLVGLAGELGVHPTYLARMFRKHYGWTMAERVRELRLAYAMKQLAESERPLADVAAAAGFYDQSHLNRVVKRFTGLTPAQLRMSVQRG